MKIITRIVGGLAALWMLAAFTFGILGIWTQDGRWGMTAALLGIAAVIAVIFFAICKDVEHVEHV